MSRLRVRAPAKINLHLEVLGRRPDGFHELRTLLQSIDLADDLTAEPAPDGELMLQVRPQEAAPAGDDNLVTAAARVLWAASGRKPGASLSLVKRIPTGAGLGGGSADAAAALVLLDRLWRLELGLERLLELAAGIGSDVPFFLVGGLALGVGRGSEVYPLPDPATLGLVLLTPRLAAPTPEVYRRLDAPSEWRPADPTVYAYAAGLIGEPPWSRLRNDLEPVVLEGWPEVGEALETLGSLGDTVRCAVTGSGSAVYALFERPGSATAAAESLAGGWRVHVGRTLGRDRARLAVEEIPS
jgi:4-diphosphocytidyl-2-C-methyl-D-erythritol kinase